DSVIFETDSSLDAAPLSRHKLFVQRASSFQDVTPQPDDLNARFRPFGRKSGPGVSLCIAFTGGATAQIGPTLSLGINVAPAAQGLTPPPVGLGSLSPALLAPRPLMQWEVLDGGRFEPAEVIEDQTDQFTRSGIVRLRLPHR